MGIRKVLVANRGEIARRVFRTCREMGLATVAVYSDPDVDEPHAREADEAVALTGASPAETYLDIDALLAAAKVSGADAVHPGYGFLSENASFARAVIHAGLTWIGPPPMAIEMMGSKITSKEIVGNAGVRTVPSIDLAGLSSVGSAALTIGYPLLVKASAGGGGKGMRIVEDPDDLMDAVAAAKREAASSFSDDAVFLEKYLQAPRHIEIQVFADSHGHVVSLFERECSIQRRHQKIIEEAPSTAVDASLRQQMGQAAMTVASAVGYVGAGTVEFLLQDGEFFFLEMNTRLQVEHPVTELITGVDLVRLQIEIAVGGRIPKRAMDASITGHAIEARLYAEDPLHGFLPVTGHIHRFDFDDSAEVRVDSGVEAGSDISVHYDPMMAKVIAHADSREEAAAKLTTALRGAHIHGAENNLALLVRILESEEFLRGEIDTHLLDRSDLEILAAPLLGEPEEALAAMATALADQAHRRRSSRVLSTIPSGWRNLSSQPQEVSYQGFHNIHVVRYQIGREGMEIWGRPDIRVNLITAEVVELAVGGEDLRYEVARYGSSRFTDSAQGQARLELLPRFPVTAVEEDVGSLHAPMPGKVLRVDVSVGEDVKEGQVLLVLEAMKMEHTLRAPHAGQVTEVSCREGDQVEGGGILVVIA